MDAGLGAVVAANVKRIRLECRWSVELAAAELDVDVAHLASIEAGAGALNLRSVEVLADLSV